MKPAPTTSCATCAGCHRDGAFYDPFTEQTFADMCAETVFAHIVPKVEQNILSRHQEISDNPGNMAASPVDNGDVGAGDFTLAVFSP